MSDTTTGLPADDYRSVAESLIVQPEAPQDETSEEAVTEQEVVEVEAEEADTETDVEEAYEEEKSTLPEILPDQLVPVQINGEIRHVPFRELTRDYSGQQKIQQNMRENAEVRKALSAREQQLSQLEQRYAEGLKSYAERLTSTELQPPDPKMYDIDPLGYLKAQNDYNQAIVEKGKLEEEQRALETKKLQEQQAIEAQAAQQATRYVMQQIPVLQDKEQGPKAIQAMMEEGLKRGFSEAELKAEKDPRMVMALYDLSKTRAQGNLSPNKEVKRGAVKPGAKKTPVSQSRKAADAARSAMKKSGRLEDVTRFLMTKG